MLLGGAIALGTLCFVGASYYMRDYLSQAESRLARSYETRKVMVAKVEVPAGTMLSEENLAVRAIPERYLASTALGPDELDMVRGQKLVVALKPGDPLDRAAIERGGDAALSTTVAIGERAITFPVDEISSISGMLVPGDIIDLVFTGSGTTANSYRQPRSENGVPKELVHVRPILQAVPVIATGKTTQKRVVNTENGGQREVDVAFSTVTLTVTPQQAEQVLLAQKLGALTAVLRNPDDKQVLARSVLDEATFKQVAARPEGGRGGYRGRYIEMIVGGLGTPGGSRTLAPQGADNPLVALLGGLGAGAAARPAAPQAPEPSAGDVRARLGVAPDPVRTVAAPFSPTK
ncbi:Flp pilus assembly protein CpaB [Massilia haematophila]|uniref:Flp pilus assembly protein CpaB n=1 Tax=Massilia haematophila TaxID=457923 RepID=A0ABV7PEB4_9BURK